MLVTGITCCTRSKSKDVGATLHKIDSFQRRHLVRIAAIAPNLGDLAKKMTPICAVHHHSDNATLDAPQSRGKHLTKNHGSVPSDSSPDIVFWVELLPV